MSGNGMFNVTNFCTFCWEECITQNLWTFFEFISFDVLFFRQLFFKILFFLSLFPSVTYFLGFSIFNVFFPLFLWFLLHWSLPHGLMVPTNALYTYFSVLSFLELKQIRKKQNKPESIKGKAGQR